MSSMRANDVMAMSMVMHGIHTRFFHGMQIWIDMRVALLIKKNNRQNLVMPKEDVQFMVITKLVEQLVKGKLVRHLC
jgi:hypothetical protein